MSLIKNNKYTVTISIAGQKFSEYFYTVLTPLYNTVSAVKNSDIGPFLDSVSDEEILLKLFEISNKADNLAEQFELTWDDDETPPRAIRKYTLEKTKYDLLLFKVYYANNQFESASLADFDISSIDYDQIKPLLDDLKAESEYWKEQMRGGKASPRSVLKSEDSEPYPFEDRTF